MLESVTEKKASQPRKKKPSVLFELLAFDEKLRSADFELVGVDEVGRGCLAGPVFAAAVVLPPVKKGDRLSGYLDCLNDSKCLSAAKRERLAEVIMGVSQYAICDASVEEIDQINILKASLLAMRRACNKLEMVSQAVVLVDGNKSIPGLSARQIMVTKGDCRSASIAAASIVAKVYRDRMMVRLASDFPQYKWESNKGYPSPAHKDAIGKNGLTPWHRLSFCKGKPWSNC